MIEVSGDVTPRKKQKSKNQIVFPTAKTFFLPISIPGIELRSFFDLDDVNIILANKPRPNWISDVNKKMTIPF